MISNIILQKQEKESLILVKDLDSMNQINNGMTTASATRHTTSGFRTVRIKDTTTVIYSLSN